MKEKEKVDNYLNKTKNHLFTKEGFVKINTSYYSHQNYMFKVFGIMIGDKQHIAKVRFNEEFASVSTYEVQGYDNECNKYRRMELFPLKGENTKSIKTFKRIRLIMESIKYNYDSLEEAELDIKTNFDEIK